MKEKRDSIIEIIRKEFVGPDPINEEGLIQKNGEEILTSDAPHVRYAAGILFPKETLIDVEEEAVEVEENCFENEPGEISGPEGVADVGFEMTQAEEDVLNLSNSYHQSALSITLAVYNDKSLYVDVSAGQYKKVDATDSRTGKKVRHYLRSKIEWNNETQELELPNPRERIKEVRIFCDGKETNLMFMVTYRYANPQNNSTVYTCTLRNVKEQPLGKSVSDEDCYFQVRFAMKSEEFPPLPENKKISRKDDEDFQSNRLLYRNIKNYAIGHGCAADWEETEPVQEIRTEIFPTYEVKPIVPNQLDDVSLEMYELSDWGNFSNALQGLEKLCNKYEEWIEEIEEKSIELTPYATAVERHLSNCRQCCSRMRNGVELLKTNEKIRKAFQYMNRAMLLQQLHYNLPLQTWKEDNNVLTLEKQLEVLPDPKDKNTWYGDINRYGKWRPFQLAFVLINLKSMYDREDDERKNVDLIWFPTGGGKTEAYLGLSAYSIFIRKLMNKNDCGTTILMRYTLRLLTSQQYERAAAMICACESIRKEKEDELGVNRITIGLWVGGDTTPNTMAKAVTAFDALKSGKSEENPFVMLKCPWCGAQMGPVVSGKGRNKRIFLPGYKKISGRSKAIRLQCANNRCIFSSDSNPLPLLVIDKDIYDNPPTLLLGTVDKFAMLPYRPEAQTIFGIRNGSRLTPPDLIIQDELHLISGPLGSMVGHYETMISELCTDRRADKEIGPKIIASTATISRAKEQCNALYNCGENRVYQFPPSGIDAGDSFFAVEDKNAVGRKYVGILAGAASSYATTTIRLYAALLYAAKAIKVNKEEERDPYWTNVGYFNSLRELGQAATWISADITEYLHTIYKRRREDKLEGYREARRYINKFDELTSRVSGSKIPVKLQDLSVEYEGKTTGKLATDICLATNMISVGVDVPRLGLMTVTGQPKTTSEYIQATSRVGRNKNAPGLIFTVYNPSRPRDKSYYEQFKSYHSKLYCHVEPTSVTPFSAPLRERALHAVLIGLVRLYGTEQTYNSPDILPKEEELDHIYDLIEKRVLGVDADELDDTLRRLDEIIEDWKAWKPQKYQDFNADDVVPLMYPAGTVRNLRWEEKGLATPTSMRSVDASCEVRAISRYETEGN